MKLSVLISTYNRQEQLFKTLAALLGQAYPLSEMELAVVDDAGDDGSYEALSARRAELRSLGFRDVKILRNEANRGIAFVRARLTAEASPESEALLFLDDDVYLEKDTIPALVDCLKKGAERGVAGPRLVYASDPQKTAHCANFVGRWTGRYSELDASAETECDWLNSSCFLVRRSALAGVAYPEEFYTAHEEVDFCLQVGRAGYKLVYFPLVKAVHDLPPSGAGRRGRLYYLYRNKLLLFKRNFPAARAFTATLLALVLGLPRYLFESVVYNRGVNRAEIGLIFRALADGLAGRGGKL